MPVTHFWHKEEALPSYLLYFICYITLFNINTETEGDRKQDDISKTEKGLQNLHSRLTCD